MIDMVMYAALGFLVASLLALMLASPLWRRAVRLTTRRIEASMPMSVTDIQADKDQLRAEYAVELRRVEVALEKAKDKAARELVQANKRRVEIAVLNDELAAAKGRLEENANANRVLEQTIKRRLPDLEARIKAAKEAIAELEASNTELRTTVASQTAALKEARAAVQTQRGEIEGLRGALEGGGRVLRLGKSDPEMTKETQRLNAELSRLKEELTRQQANAEENGALRQELDKLAAQLLAAALGQPIPEPVAAPAEPFIPYTAEPALEEAMPEPEPEPVAPATHVIPLSPEPESVPAAPEASEPALHGTNGSNGIEAPEAEEAEAVAETQEPPEAVAEDETPEAERRGSLAQRIVSRRAKRRAAAKDRGRSLSDRLKDIPADAPET
jgi:hypothetical protein